MTLGQRTKGGMWCKRCGPVMGVKNTHKVRNTGSLLGELLLPGAALMGSKVEGYVCPSCGSRVHPAWMGRGGQPAGGAGRYNVTCPSCSAALVSPAGDNIKCPECGFRMKVWPLDTQPAPEPSATKDGATTPVAPDRAREQTMFAVILTAVDSARRTETIEVLHDVTIVTRETWQELVDSVPIEVKDDIGRAEANAIKAGLEDVGAAVELRPTSDSEIADSQVARRPATDLVVITHVDPGKKIAVLKIVREATGLPLKEVIKIVETHEAIECADETEAKMLKADLEQAAATIELRASLDDENHDDKETSEITSGLTDELERLAELHRAGGLSDEEFAAAKTKVLGM